MESNKERREYMKRRERARERSKERGRRENGIEKIQRKEGGDEEEGIR